MSYRAFRPQGGSQVAFTIVELMAAMAVFIGLMLILVTATTQTGNMWRRSTAKVEQFQQARRAFESMTRKVSQATLNTYWDYKYPLTTSGAPDYTAVPTDYIRQSELRFRSGLMSSLAVNAGDGVVRPTQGIFFHAPLGFVEDRGQNSLNKGNTVADHTALDNLLNVWGYFIEVSSDTALIPSFLKTTIPTHTRSRLMEMMESSERVLIDNPSPSTASNNPYDKPWDGWYLQPLKRHSTAVANQNDPVHVLAENVIALVILPRLSQEDEAARLKDTATYKQPLLSPKYDYDSKRISNSAAAIANPLELYDSLTDPGVNPKNQLPPVVTVAMVAIDEISAQRLASKTNNSTNLNLNMNTLFIDATKLENNTNTAVAGDGDLYTLEQTLLAQKLNYRVFTADVTIRGARWSRWQSNQTK